MILIVLHGYNAYVSAVKLSEYAAVLHHVPTRYSILTTTRVSDHTLKYLRVVSTAALEYVCSCRENIGFVK